MDWTFWLWFILIGLVVGWLAGLIVKGSGSGFLLNIVIGIVGAILGGWLFSLIGVSATSWWGSLITALVGAIVLLLIVGLFTRKKA
ncbi:MAG: GlsB/YeaQ/YmgE family stress response membrane protein [Rikenellaceae bacterium]|nr:GlsB/YeaQ/YmgE family stress response membrane protein [Rikenellaceae bacterium]MCL2693065.1 GlsB/YeaQ/YmgE family stress response membrane protein [Rikenellaceae bacterium]